MPQKQGEQPSTKAYFEMYAAMGPERSLEKLARQLYHQQLEEGETLPKETTWLSKLKKWSAEYEWQARVVEYDRELIREKRRAKEALIERMNDEHALLGRTHALRAAKTIDELIEKGKMNGQAAVTLFKIATDLERIARDAPTEITRMVDDQPKIMEHTVSFDLSKLSDEQLRKLEEVAGELESPVIEEEE